MGFAEFVPPLVFPLLPAVMVYRRRQRRVSHHTENLYSGILCYGWGMPDDDAPEFLKRWARREYLRQHEAQRRALDRAEGARRIDVTLRGEMLDDYATVRRYIEGLNRFMAERNIAADPIQLSDTEIIKQDGP
jgi:hypothetical protein